MDRPTHELEAYFAGDATDEQLRIVEAWINTDPANARAFVQQLHFRELLGEHLREQRSDNRAVLAELARLEAAQEADIVTIINLDQRIREQDKASISASDLAAVGSYLLRHALTPKRLAYGGLAAALLLGLTIFIALQAGTPPAPTGPTDVVQLPEDVQQPARIVATLTAQHDAQWSGGDGAPGLRLQAGQRFTLTTGFAEINTQDGVVAVLEGPCTIELMDGNAMRLSHGKLVAQVSPKATGFTVHTPTARVVDYGTQFGVEVQEDGSTHAAVFVGEVELSERAHASSRPSRSVRLTEGWAAQVTDQGRFDDAPVPVTPMDHHRYARSFEEVLAPSFAYRRAVLASKPLLYWGFDDNKAATENLAGNDAWSGQAIGQTDRGTGVVGSALKLKGQVETRGGFASESPLTLESNASFTIEAWYKSDRLHWGRVASLMVADPSLEESREHFAVVEVLGGEHLSATFSSQTGNARFLYRGQPRQAGNDLFSQVPAPVGQWTHLVVVRDSKASRLYINGVLASEQADDQAVSVDVSLNLHIGLSQSMLGDASVVHPGIYRGFEGLIDEVALYDQALPAETIQQHFDLGRPVASP